LLKVATEENYFELEKSLNMKLKKEEDLIIARKVKKFDRDRRDYDEGNVYVKRQPRSYHYRGPRSILKRTPQHKHVSFSSADDSYGLDEDTARSPFPVSSSPQSDRESLALEVFNDTSKKSFDGSINESKNEIEGDYRRSQRTKECNRPEATAKQAKGQQQMQQQRAGPGAADGEIDQHRTDFNLFETLVDVNRFVRKIVLKKYFLTGNGEKDGGQLLEGKDMDNVLLDFGSEGEQSNMMDSDPREMDNVSPCDNLRFDFQDEIALFNLNALSAETNNGILNKHGINLNDINVLKDKSNFYPINHRGPAIDAFQDLIENELRELQKSTLRTNSNLTNKEALALKELSLDGNIIVRKADKG
ncbi:hypothetical protein XELAEV_18021309mg, partial [Xenopus laevis]